MEVASPGVFAALTAIRGSTSERVLYVEATGPAGGLRGPAVSRPAEAMRARTETAARAGRGFMGPSFRWMGAGQYEKLALGSDAPMVPSYVLPTMAAALVDAWTMGPTALPAAICQLTGLPGQGLRLM